MRSWEAVLRQAPVWREHVIAGMGDVRAFEEFAAALPAVEQNNAIHIWRETWLVNLSTALLSVWIDTTEQMIYSSLESNTLAGSELIADYILSPKMRTCAMHDRICARSTGTCL